MANAVSILEGSTFVVSDRKGDIDASPTDAQGLFDHDTRYLSRWNLRVDGHSPGLLSTDEIEYHRAQFFLVPVETDVYVNAKASLLRQRWVGNGFHEEIVVENHDTKPASMTLRLDCASDYADLFEVKDGLPKHGEFYRVVGDRELLLGYRRERFVRETRITSDQQAAIDEDGFSFEITVPPRGEWRTNLDVAIGGDPVTPAIRKPKYASGTEVAAPIGGTTLQAWLERAPVLNTPSERVSRTYRRSLVDLAALRFFPGLTEGMAMPAAGLPWFMALFGRDSIITSLQALPFVPELASTTLKVLGLRQGTRIDPFRDEEPGKILHEVRWGEMTAFEERPQSPYFGSADATQLFVILLDEYERWTGDLELVRKLEKAARGCIDWIDNYGDRDGDGYIEYERAMETGLENQCWRDSWDSICFRDGSLASLPRATSELQGYAYDAKMRAARLARVAWNDEAFASRLEDEAAKLKTRFNQDFWVEDRGFYALGLDGQKRQIDSMTSNIGHLLWSGIVNDDRAAICAEQLVGEALYSGWGVRTMAATEGGYNPIGYHLGTIWPHDNSIIALGLRRYGFAREAARIALGMFDASEYFNYRLPEAFAGYPREQTRFPVEYPTACSPQAWATGAPFLFLRTLLGLEPVGGNLLTVPAIPKEIGQIELLGIPGRWGMADAFGRGLLEGVGATSS